MIVRHFVIPVISTTTSNDGYPLSRSSISYVTMVNLTKPVRVCFQDAIDLLEEGLLHLESKHGHFIVGMKVSSALVSHFTYSSSKRDLFHASWLSQIIEMRDFNSNGGDHVAHEKM